MNRPTSNELVNNAVVYVARCFIGSASADQLDELLQLVDDWQLWLRRLEEHGLASIAYALIEAHDLSVPKEMRLSLRGLCIRHEAAAKARYQAFAALHNGFAKADIPYVALKGLALAPMLYGEDSLRPMRDMDILVPADRVQKAAEVARGAGFDLPRKQSSKFMRGGHQLPNATRMIDGFKVSLELHRDALGRDVSGHMRYDDVKNDLQQVEWQGLKFDTLAPLQMISQVSRHAEALHPGAILKLINVIDVVLLANEIENLSLWSQLEQKYPHVINSLRCFHLWLALPDAIAKRAQAPDGLRIAGVGESMRALSVILGDKSIPRLKRFTNLFTPPEWWLHLYYNRAPEKSIWFCRLVQHPIQLIRWAMKRFRARLFGGFFRGKQK